MSEKPDDDWPSGPVQSAQRDGGPVKGKTIPCPNCGMPVRISRGIGLADWRLVPGNTVLRCRHCGHVFRAPKSVVWSTRLVGAGLGFLLAAGAVLFLLFWLVG